MKKEIIEIDINNLKKSNPNNLELSITVGAFDGIHLGHLELIKNLGKNKCAFTFKEHPDYLLEKRKNSGIINDFKEKCEILFSLGIEYIYVIPEDALKLSYLDFNKLLLELNVKEVVVGADFHYGCNGLGGVKELEKDFNVKLIPFLKYDNNKISSTYLRNLLDLGNIELLNKLLVKPFKVEGQVNNGHKIGSTLGFRTANLTNNKYQGLRRGVYKSKVVIDNKEYNSVCNYGINPTINTYDEAHFEIQILDFDEDIYDQDITLYLLEFIRDEIKFNNKYELIEQIKKDIEKVKA